MKNKKSPDVVILGAGFRGLWLSAELVKLGWSVTWGRLHMPDSGVRQGGFRFDDWPWQIGVFRPESALAPHLKDFIDNALEPMRQKISTQILTPQGPLELSGGGEALGLKKFFPRSYKELTTFIKCIEESRKIGGQKGLQLLFAHTKKIYGRPLGERWCLEWLGAIRRSRSLAEKNWLEKCFFEIISPHAELLLIKDGMEETVDRCMAWAERKGVTVIRDASIADIGVEGRNASGIEIRGEGFLPCKHIVLACSYQTFSAKVPGLTRQIDDPVLTGSEKWVWVRCGFLLKSNSRPEGLLEFSSFVIDPHMPLVDSNLGLMRWRAGEKGDSLTVWVRIPYGELKRRSYLMNLTEEIQRNLTQLLPRFSSALTAVFPFEEYFHSPIVELDDLAIVFKEHNRLGDPTTRLKNVWLMGPSQDWGLEILSRFGTEFRALQRFTAFRKKELKKSDRKIHSARNGPDMVHPK